MKEITDEMIHRANEIQEETPGNDYNQMRAVLEYAREQFAPEPAFKAGDEITVGTSNTLYIVSAVEGDRVGVRRLYSDKISWYSTHMIER